jgi:hypothetical protein
MHRSHVAVVPSIRRALGALALAVATVTVPLSVTSNASATPSLCGLITPALVSSTLGLHASAGDKQVNGSVTVCWYRVGALSKAAFVRTQPSDTLTGFNADRKLAAQYSESPRPDTHFAPYPPSPRAWARPSTASRSR